MFCEDLRKVWRMICFLSVFVFVVCYRKTPAILTKNNTNTRNLSITSIFLGCSWLNLSNPFSSCQQFYTHIGFVGILYHFPRVWTCLDQHFLKFFGLSTNDMQENVWIQLRICKNPIVRLILVIIGWSTIKCV